MHKVLKKWDSLASQKMAVSNWDFYKWSPRFNSYWFIFIGILLKNNSISSFKRSKSLYLVKCCVFYAKCLQWKYIHEIQPNVNIKCKHKRAKDHWHDTRCWTNMFRIKTDDWYDLRCNNNNYVLGKPEIIFMEKSFTYSELCPFGITYQV